jgi:MoxR-like ATPase
MMVVPVTTQVRTKVLDLIASDPGIQQTELVLLGLFGRSVRLLSSSSTASPGRVG